MRRSSDTVWHQVGRLNRPCLPVPCTPCSVTKSKAYLPPEAIRSLGPNLHRHPLHNLLITLAPCRHTTDRSVVCDMDTTTAPSTTSLIEGLATLTSSALEAISTSLSEGNGTIALPMDDTDEDPSPGNYVLVSLARSVARWRLMLFRTEHDSWPPYRPRSVCAECLGPEHYKARSLATAERP